MNERPISGLIVLLLALAAIGGLFLWAQTRAPGGAAITIAAPAGGEAWQTGSTQTVSWASKGVPATHKVAITIRRIPPPPLQTEGQEFDPIIFTDLPNTGSVDWTIADMYPAGTYVLGLTAYESTPVTNPITAESAQFTISHPGA